MYRQGIVRAGLVLLVLAGAFAAASPAGAAKFKELGKPARHVGNGGSCGTCNAFQLETAPATPSYVVPNGDWTIVSWKAHGLKKGKSKARLRIYRPSTSVQDQFEIVAESHVERFRARRITEHRTRIPVQSGDHLGIVGVGDFASSYDGRDADSTGQPTGCIFPTVGFTVGGAGADCGTNVIGGARVNVGVTLKRR